MIFLFFTFLFLLLYIYFLYPVVLRLIPVRKGPEFDEKEEEKPYVTVLTAAFNEERHIGDKIRNVLEQDYHLGRCEIIVSSDGSQDSTVEIARGFHDPRVKIIDNDERGGKNAALNKAVPDARGEILVFTDANAMFTRNAIRKLVQHFQNPEVGLVCGHLRYLKDGAENVGRGEGLYFRYESLLKMLESRLGAVTVVTGSIYAIRRDLWEPLEDDVANDFVHPVKVGSRGYWVVFEPDAIAWEKTTSSAKEEFRRRARIVTRGFTAFGKYWKKYHILHGLRGFCFVSHKLLRWFAPFFLAGLFVTNAILEGTIFRITLLVQVAFYISALCGLFINGKKAKIFVVPFYYCMINLAALTGFFNYIRGRKQSLWEVAKTTR